MLLGAWLAMPATASADQPAALDLSGFTGIAPAGDGSVRLDDVGPCAAADSTANGPGRRWYASAIVGANFGWLAGDGNIFLVDAAASRFADTGFTGGGAVGVAIDRPTGLLRVEFEARARGPIGDTATETFGADVVSLDQSVTDGWSTMVNVWRDWFLTDRLGGYLGGGVGAGGYRYGFRETASFLPGESLTGSAAVGGLAGQVGGGAIYAVSDRLTIDVGYRFFTVQAGRTTALVEDGVSPPLAIADAWSAFSASELLLTLRVYEPFRRWTR
jgi:opacity protein-like surface antigen